MKRRFYPSTRTDRQGFWAGIANGLLAVFILYLGDYWWAAFFGAVSGSAAIVIYVFQDEPERGDSSEYSVVIAQIGGIEKQLSELSTFLERERKRVAETETTLSKLEEEKTKLEPIVLSQRETVEAILTAHSSRIARNAWKERLVGFILGTMASIAAAYIYGYFKR
ncbi:MAG: hypothetical protein AABN34_08850 [Acidobacteriota bacterium]